MALMAKPTKRIIAPNMPNNISLKTALLLRDAGWVQEAADFYHLCGSRGFIDDGKDGGYVGVVYYGNGRVSINPQKCAAPTTDELLEALPIGVELQKETLDGQPDGTVTYCVALWSHEISDIEAPSPTEALALLWLELRKQKLA